jgi:hypothetical protein
MPNSGFKKRKRKEIDPFSQPAGVQELEDVVSYHLFQDLVSS